MIIQEKYNLMPKQSPRKGRYGFYTPPETRQCMQDLRVIFLEKMRLKGYKAFGKDKKLRLSLIAKTNRRKSDIDNYFKIVMDAGSGILYHDDSQVKSVVDSKIIKVKPEDVFFILSLSEICP